jgi:hypothetical protein
MDVFLLKTPDEKFDQVFDQVTEIQRRKQNSTFFESVIWFSSNRQDRLLKSENEVRNYSPYCVSGFK